MKTKPAMFLQTPIRIPSLEHSLLLVLFIVCFLFVLLSDGDQMALKIVEMPAGDLANEWQYKKI